MRTESEVQADLQRCYNAIAEITAGKRIFKFTFSSAESSQSYESTNPTLKELSDYKQLLLDELASIQSSTPTNTPKFTKAYFQTVYDKLG